MSTVNGNVITMVTTPANCQVKVICNSAPVLQGSSIVAKSFRTIRTDESGDWSMVLAMGNYKVEITDGKSQFVTTFEIDVPDDSDTYDVDSLITSNTIYTPGAPSGFDTSSERLIETVESEGFEATSITYDSDGVATTAVVKWPDGAPGVFATVTKNSTFLTIDAYTVTHTTSGKTVTQAAVTRNSVGQVTVKPALTVSP